ncbi:hypothetical protein [Streptomyces sp. NBC_00582]|uniref:hypothetical protein n=1 Tax=Streptomyces sp. NBC_00582 TaxID=2975783 RepID=UPI002E7FCFA6|nr:hypothetical protein [Streptomyces sp. NBC_00582]WUB59023.1 hypothetical protein OG852_00440 [Streptomyces sp. NBC_00582]WUB67705.1 hypothetical protein OG852_48695 [Streptomyces sp. NBC_00582]
MDLLAYERESEVAWARNFVERMRGQLDVAEVDLLQQRIECGALLLAKPVTTEKRRLDIPGIVVVGEGRPAVLDNPVQNRLGF